MAGHTSEKRWDTKRTDDARVVGVSEVASEVAKDLVIVLTTVEERYLELLEVFNYAGGTNTDLAELLFKEEIAARSSPDNVASADEIAKVNDLVDAMTSAHELYQAANNIAVTTKDRFAALRRMS